MKGFRNFSHYLVYSNIFIGCCATALAAETFVLLQLPPSLNWYLLLLGCCTLFVYCLHYYVKIKKDKTDSRLQWCRQHSNLLLLLMTGSALAIGGGVVWHFNSIFLRHGHINWNNLAWFIIVPLLALGYSHPLNPWNKKSLRQTGWLKLVLLSFTWSFTTTVLPVLMLVTDHTPPVYPLLVLFIHRFFFIASLCVLFNIGDYEEDKADGVHTIAVLLGPAQTLQKGKRLTLLLNTACTIWLITSFGLYAPVYYLALGIPVVLVYLSFQYFRSPEEEAFFVLRYDGLMIVKALLLIFALLTQQYK